MLDSDLVEYFGATTGNFNRAMKRNIKRFPEKFCFQLLAEECSRFQIGILKKGRGSNIKYLPYVYTEQGNCHADICIAYGARNRRQYMNYGKVSPLVSKLMQRRHAVFSRKNCCQFKILV